MFVSANLVMPWNFYTMVHFYLSVSKYFSVILSFPETENSKCFTRFLSHSYCIAWTGLANYLSL